MSGHSKFSNIKHKKGAEDAKRSKLFLRLAKELKIEYQKNPNLETNHPLNSLIKKAQKLNFPKDKINNIVKGKTEKVSYQEIYYAGKILKNVSIIVYCLTDNINRTSPFIKSLFTKYNGSIENLNQVAFQFNHYFVVKIAANEVKNLNDILENLILETPLDKYEQDSENITCYYFKENISKAIEYLNAKAINFEYEQMFLPKNGINLDAEKHKKLLIFIDLLEKSDNVDEFWTNVEI